MNLNSKKIALWLTVVMLVSFAIAASVATTSINWKSLVTGDLHFGTNSSTFVPMDERTSAAAAGIDLIYVETTAEDVNITYDSSNAISAHLFGRVNKELKPKLIQEKVGNEMRIRVEHPSNLSSSIITYDEATLDITLPSSYAGKLSMKTVSGDTQIPALKLSGLKLNTVSGDLTSAAASPDTDITTISGNMNLSSLSGKLRTNSVSGDIQAGFSSFQGAEIVGEAVSGSTELTLPSGSEFNLDFSTVSGDLDNNQRDSRSSSNSIRIHSVSGDLTIH